MRESNSATRANVGGGGYPSGEGAILRGKKGVLSSSLTRGRRERPEHPQTSVLLIRQRMPLVETFQT